MNRVLRHIRRAALLRARDGATDAQLVESFVTRRDEAAFEALLRRYGPMVMGVCRRVLRHAQDAEDAFQATFLVLARKAGSLRSRDLLGNWLYGVAQRTAIKARAMGVKRRTKERQAGEFSCRTPTGDGIPDELLARLDTELSRLPHKYRAPIVLCELEGKSRKDVARLLGLTEGTLSSRLARAKKLLARRLSWYGAAFSVGSLTAALAQDTAACVRPALLNSTARAAVLTAGAVSARVAALTEGVLKAMLLSKLKLVWAVVLAAVVGAGAVGLTYRQAAAQTGPSNAAPRASRAAADELEELRLEVAALRKGLESTRERVKALEGEVQALRGPRRRGLNFRQGATAKPLDPTEADRQMLQRLEDARLSEPAGPLAEAEAALKKLRANPNDKQAADALERALKQLKEREKPELPRVTRPDDPVGKK
jgi:RNA polymerase sigma-70 factor (ECF subfamily)